MGKRGLMAFSMENYKYVQDILARRRTEAEDKARRNTAWVHEHSEEIREIDRKLSSTGFALIRAAMDKAPDVRERVAALREENLALQARRAALLREMGLPENYTAVIPVCAACKDAGHLDSGAMCACMRALLVEAGYRSSGLGSLLKKQSFDNFSLHFYEGDARRLATVALERAKEFAESFEKTGQNLLFMGGTGLGKTHLSTAIAKRAIERGFDVVYETAQNVISDFEYDRFKSGYGQSEDVPRSEKYFSCDLLILDDLGVEMSNQFTLSALYNVINTRINLGKSMLVSTNLGQKALLERYDERITSRLFGEFNPYLFRGTDIRLQK